MRVASVSEAKNRLSALLDLVRGGESVLIVDRGVPVARLEPAVKGEGADEARLARLERAGLIRRRTGPPPVALISSEEPPKARDGGSVLEALLEERREGR
jgi:prevent-host-death family protein